MDQQEDITRFQSRFNGPFPFASDGVLVGRPDASFEEEMQTMITFAGGEIDLDTFHHENMHQWWGDNVSESNYNMTFFKEGLATLGEYLFDARTAASTGGPAAFDKSLIDQFNATYARTGNLWRNAPSNPTAYNLFSGSSTYTRPGTAYIALRQILGSDRFNLALQHIQRRYGGGTINERQLQDGFAQWLPNRSASCRAKLGEFFTQWFDTPYPTPSGATKPQITGPGLDGGGFYNSRGGCD
jgi:aminopeptidase N